MGRPLPSESKLLQHVSRQAQDSTIALVGKPPVVRFDIENAFLLFAAFTGDVERTAHALNVSPVDVLRVVDAEGWMEKLRPIIALKKSNRPGDIERAINRAMCFVQAHRFRLFLDRMVRRISEMSPEEAEEYLMQESVTEGGKVTRKMSTRPLADLASALEKCHAMTYVALNDTATERVKRNERQDSETSGGELHAQIANALAAVRASASPRAQLFEAQVLEAQHISQNHAVPVQDDSHEGEDS